MKSIKILYSLLAVIGCATTFIACSDNDTQEEYAAYLDFNNSKITYNPETMAWSDVFESAHNNDLVYVNYQFSHEGYKSEYGDYFYGFCPSKSSDVNEYKNDWIPNHQFSAITGKSVFVGMNDQPYMVAYWNEYGDTQNGAGMIPESPSCAITSSKPFTPYGVFITNSTYTYYAIKNGTSFSRPFAPSDSLTLYIHGVRNGMTTGTVTVDLASNGEILKDWLPVSLTKLGTVDMIYFTMKTTDTNKYGSCTPTYFCLDGLAVMLDSTSDN